MKPLKILGIRPPEVDVTLRDSSISNKEISVTPKRASAPCLGLFYLKTILKNELKERGYDSQIDLIDLAASSPEELNPYAQEFSDLSTVAYGSGIIHKQLRGRSLESLAEKARESGICYMSSPFAAGASTVAQTMKALRRYNPQIKIILGGRDAQFRSEWYLGQGADVVFLGQAEGLVGKVVDALTRGDDLNLAGIATKKHSGFLGSFSRNADLSKEVLPEFDKNLLELYSQSCDGILPQGITGPLMWYFTSVGCIRNCNFCPTGGTKYLSLSPERTFGLLEHYKKSGVRVLLSAEDNFLARLKTNPKNGEREIIDIMRTIRSLGFGHEFSNGLEVGLLADSNGKIREELISELFARSGASGTYRMYWPIETFVRRGDFAKLSTKETHYRILDSVLQTGIPEIVFNNIVFSDYSPREIQLLEKELEGFTNWMSKHQRSTKWSIPLFHELALPGSSNFAKLSHRAFDINKHSELWAVPINPLDGVHFSYYELYKIKRRLMTKFSPQCLESWDNLGRYENTQKTN